MKNMESAQKLKNVIDGRLCDPCDKKYISNINPADGTTISMIPESTNADVCSAVASAKKALARSDWNHAYISARTRAEWLSKIADGIQSRLEIFAQAESLDTGNYCY